MEKFKTFYSIFMLTLDEFYKDAWCRLAGKELKQTKLIGFTKQQIDKLFEELDTKEINQLCTNRLVMGSLRYNATGLKTDPKYNILKTLQLKLDLYNSDGNQEHLLDLIKYAKLEIINKTHPLSHFNAVDDGIHAIIK